MVPALLFHAMPLKPMNTAAREDNCFPLLTDIALFKALSGEQLRFLAADCYRRHARKGQVVCDKGVVLDGFYAVREGRVKLAMLSEEGSERVVQIAEDGDTFGEGLGLTGQPSPIYAQTLCDSHLLFFRAERVRAALYRWPALAMLFLSQTCNRVHELYRDLEACCLHSALQRVAGYLLERLQCVRDQENPSAVRVSLPAGKAVVASRLNLTPETFSRELRHLSAQGAISVERGVVNILSVDMLHSAAGRS
jgi:CRP-like cAMP-binding protein